MDIVNPQPIRSPYTGDLIQPRIREREYLGKIYTEAHWICPSTGEFIRKGIVKVVDVNKSDQKN